MLSIIPSLNGKLSDNETLAHTVHGHLMPLSIVCYHVWLLEEKTHYCLTSCIAVVSCTVLVSRKLMNWKNPYGKNSSWKSLWLSRHLLRRMTATFSSVSHLQRSHTWFVWDEKPTGSHKHGNPLGSSELWTLWGGLVQWQDFTVSGHSMAGAVPGNCVYPASVAVTYPTSGARKV